MKVDQPTFDETKNYYEELVGEGKKYKDNEALAKKAIHADVHIRNLEAQMDALREDYLNLKEQSAAGTTLQELIDQLRSQSQTQTSNEPPPNVNAANPQKPGYDPDELKSLVSNTVNELRNSEREQDNYRTVLAKVKERYGDNYSAVLKEQATQLGLSDTEVDTMAKKNPKLFMKTFEVDAPRTADNFQTPPQSKMRNDNFAPRVERRTQSYYDKLRRENPNKYFEPKTLIQMDRDLLALGEAFFDVP